MNEQMQHSTNAKRTVLWLDDDPGLILLVQWALSRNGYYVIGYADVPTAVEALKTAPEEFDVIVTDLSMPAERGLDTARHLMSIKPNVPMILSANYIRPDVEKRALECGIRVVIEKSASVRELCAALDRVLG